VVPSSQGSKARCAVTNYSYSVEDAHLIPRAEALWYERNGMDRYGGQGLGDINNSANILPLRSDIHRCFDDRWFVIVPKLATPPSHQYVTHLISNDAAEISPTHNTLVQYLSVRSTPYLFAHFAWAVLLRLKAFINSGISRNVVRNSGSRDKIERNIEILDGMQLKSYYSGVGSKACTPRNKRSRNSPANDEDILLESSDDEHAKGSSTPRDVMDQWEWHARRQRQESSGETVVDEGDQPEAVGELKEYLQEVFSGSENLETH
jgi:hypothetical protein